MCGFAPCECYQDGSGVHSCGTDKCTCEQIKKIRTDERSRWNTPYWSVDYHRGYRQAQQDERERWVKTITLRIADLRHCGKDDDCQTKADGAELALDDGLYVGEAQTYPTMATPPAPEPVAKGENPRVAYAQGFLDALEETSWTCCDCGNTYDPNITDCPNRYLDEAKVALRAAQHKAGEME